MSDQERTRWLDRESPADAALGDLLDAGKTELPSAAQLRSLAERLGPPFDGPGPGGGGGGGGGGAAGVAAPAASIVPLASAAAAIAVLCTWWWMHTGSADDARVRQHASAPQAAAAAPPAPAPPTASAPTSPSSVPLEQRAGDGGTARASTRQPARAPTRSPPRVRDPLAELALLEQAHRALAAEPARALTAVESHARQFPASQYAQERELIAIQALLELGQSVPARARAQRFLALYPRSTHGRKIRALIAANAAAAAADSNAAKVATDAGAVRR